MKIFRVEDNEGYGCYNAHIPEKFIDKHCALTGHPRPEQDIGILREQKMNEICGFKDKKQAKKWFTYYELRKMEEYDFYLKEIDVKEITAIGEKQVLAIR